MHRHPAFSSRPALAQFARSGSWETALSFDHRRVPTRASLLAFLDSTDEVAFEVFFGDAFFGVRLEGQASLVARLSSACVEAFSSSLDGNTFFESLQDASGWKGLGQTASFTEIGTVNAWRSVGSFRMPPPDQALLHLEELWPLICRTPLARDIDHKKALEFAYEHPVKHWFALPVSRSIAPLTISHAMLRQALESALHREGATEPPAFFPSGKNRA